MHVRHPAKVGVTEAYLNELLAKQRQQMWLDEGIRVTEYPLEISVLITSNESQLCFLGFMKKVPGKPALDLRKSMTFSHVVTTADEVTPMTLESLQKTVWGILASISKRDMDVNLTHLIKTSLKQPASDVMRFPKHAFVADGQLNMAVNVYLERPVIEALCDQINQRVKSKYTAFITGH